MTPIIPTIPAGLSYGPEYDRVFAALCAEVETSNHYRAEIEELRIAVNEWKAHTVAAEIKLTQMRIWLDSNTTWCAPADAPLLGLYGQRIWYHVTDNVNTYPFTAVIDAGIKDE